MTPEETQLLQKAIQLSEENNKILRHMQSAARWARAARLIKYVIILILLAWSFYYLQPYIKKINDLYKQVESLQTTTQNLNSKSQDLIKDYKSFDLESLQKSLRK